MSFDYTTTTGDLILSWTQEYPAQCVNVSVAKGANFRDITGKKHYYIAISWHASTFCWEHKGQEVPRLSPTFPCSRYCPTHVTPSSPVMLHRHACPQVNEATTSPSANWRRQNTQQRDRYNRLTTTPPNSSLHGANTQSPSRHDSSVELAPSTNATICTAVGRTANSKKSVASSCRAAVGTANSIKSVANSCISA